LKTSRISLKFIKFLDEFGNKTTEKSHRPRFARNSGKLRHISIKTL
jgi:hypothetical protein